MLDQQEEERSKEALLEKPEPWEPWESKLVAGCLFTAIIGLVILGWLIHTYVLN